MESELRIPIEGESDIVRAREEGRRVASELNLSSSDLTFIAVAISEVARNIVAYAKRGEIEIGLIKNRGRRGVRIVARDEGPGIEDVQAALQDGYSTSGSPGLGLPGARRLMDELEIEAKGGKGTVVTMCKWER